MTRPMHRNYLSYACLLFATVSSYAIAQEFADDFNTQYFDLGYRVDKQSLANSDTVDAVINNQLILSLIAEDPATLTEDAAYWLTKLGVINSMSTTMTFTGDRPVSGVAEYDFRATFFNKSADGGLSPDSRVDNIEIEIALFLGVDEASSAAIYCFKLRDENESSRPVVPENDLCYQFAATPQPNTTYELFASANRETNELTVRLNDEEISQSLPYEVFLPSANFHFSRIRLRGGLPTASITIDEYAVDGVAVDLNAAPFLDRYRYTDTYDYTDDPLRVRELVDGRLKLGARTFDSGPAIDADLRISTLNNYIGADIEYSSESDVDFSNNGYSAVRVAGILYNDTSNDSNDGLLGSVYVSLGITKNAAAGQFAEYCIFRSNNDNFTDATELGDLSNGDECPIIDIPVLPDTAYRVSIALDELANQIIFSFGDQTNAYEILTPIFRRPNTSLRARSSIGSGAVGTTIGYFDNLRNNPTTPTASEALIPPDASEPNNSPQNATSIQLGESLLNSLHLGDGVDYFEFELSDEQLIAVEFDNAGSTQGFQISMTITDSNGNVIQQVSSLPSTTAAMTASTTRKSESTTSKSASSNSASNALPQLVLTLPAGVYTIEVTAPDGIPVPAYTLSLTSPPTCDVTLDSNQYTLANNQYELLSLPCEPPAGTTVVDLFGDDIPGTYRDAATNTGTWVVFTYDANAGDYVDMGEGGVLQPGQGFWITQISGSSVVLDLPMGSIGATSNKAAGAACKSTTGCRKIPLSGAEHAIEAATGLPRVDLFNLIGNPFNATAAFDDLTVTTSMGNCSLVAKGCVLDNATLPPQGENIVGNVLFSYDSSIADYAPNQTGSTLTPWTGYWIPELLGAVGNQPFIHFPDNR